VEWHRTNHVRPKLKADDVGRFAAIDIESGEFAIDADELKACGPDHDAGRRRTTADFTSPLSVSRLPAYAIHMENNAPGTPGPGAPPLIPSGRSPATVAVEPRLTPELVFREHTPRIYNLARRILGSDADAEDVTQDVLLQVVGKLSTFRGEASLPTWLHRVTVNAALAYRRKQAVREEHQMPDPLENFLHDGHHHGPVHRWNVGPEQAALNHETHELIERAIARLPELYRDVFVLADVEELPNPEIADMLGLTVMAVKSRLHRARLLMRNALAPHFEEVPA